MRKIIINTILVFSLINIGNAVEIGDKIELGKSVIYTVRCDSYTENLAKYYFLGMLSIVKKEENYIEKISKNTCQSVLGLNNNDRKMVGIIVDKKQQILTDKDLSLLEKGTITKFEILKLSILSFGKMKMKRGEVEFWFTFPKDSPTYKIIK